MPNWIKLSDERKRTLIFNTLTRIEKDYPFKSDDDFEVLLKCSYLIKENKFEEKHFNALIQIPNGKLYWNIIKDLALKGNIDDRVLEAFEKEYLK